MMTPFRTSLKYVTKESLILHRSLSSSSPASLSSLTKQKPKTNNDANFQPLLDTFGRRHDYLRISLTERCNLRCKILLSFF